MSDTTELLLKKYYGFGVDPENKKFLSSHEATYDPCKFLRRAETPETTETEAIEESLRQGTSSEITKDSVKNVNQGFSIGEKIIRSSRAIADEEVLEEDKDAYEYDAVLDPAIYHEQETNDNFEVPYIQEPTTPKIEKIDDSNISNENYALTSNLEDTLENDACSIATKKKPRKKSALTASSLFLKPSQTPKKLPSCNGIFLDLTNLSLTEFPIKITSSVPHLRMLYLENNSLSYLPDEIFSNLRLLQWLDVRNNQLKTLPKSMKHHPSLETILLDGNLFEELPLELCLLPNLKELQTARNPLINPPADVLALGFAATMNFLRLAWNKENPEEIVESPDRKKKIKPSTILCSDPPVLRTLSKFSRIFGSSSTGHMSEGMKKISVRQKARNYRPSNRCKNRGPSEELEKHLLWIAQVKEMLTKQTMELQKIKDQDALNKWRRDRRSYEKSMKRASDRTEEDIPFAIDLEDGMIMKSSLKMPLKNVKWKKRDVLWLTNIDKKMNEIFESLNELQKKRSSDELSPRGEQKLLENEIRKLSDMHEQIESLQRCNETTTTPFEASKFLPKTEMYKSPPSIII